MPFYALATIPLIKCLPTFNNSVRQVWYADDASATGSLDELKSWWTAIIKEGPKYGYYVNPKKSWIVVEDGFKESAQQLFAESDINITDSGRPFLGAAI